MSNTLTENLHINVFEHIIAKVSHKKEDLPRTQSLHQLFPLSNLSPENSI